jgi:cobalamin biosynthesis Mg chelatase CobN
LVQLSATLGYSTCNCPNFTCHYCLETQEDPYTPCLLVNKSTTDIDVEFFTVPSASSMVSTTEGATTQSSTTQDTQGTTQNTQNTQGTTQSTTEGTPTTGESSTSGSTTTENVSDCSKISLMISLLIIFVILL